MGRPIPEVRISVKGEPELGDVFVITFLFNKAYFPLIAAWWNLHFLHKSNYSPSLTLTTDAQITREHNHFFFPFPRRGMWDLVPRPGTEPGPPALGRAKSAAAQAAGPPQPPIQFPARTDSPAVTSGYNCHGFLCKPMFLRGGTWSSRLSNSFCGADISNVAKQIGGQLPYSWMFKFVNLFPFPPNSMHTLKSKCSHRTFSSPNIFSSQWEITPPIFFKFILPSADQS